MKKYLIIVALFIFSNFCKAAEHKFLESDYNDYWCKGQNGVREFETIDGSRVDCLLPCYAVEGERAYKWKEAVGQSLFYGIQTQRQPAILLIIENSQKEQRYIKRANKVAARYGIRLWYITPEDLILRKTSTKP